MTLHVIAWIRKQFLLCICQENLSQNKSGIQPNSFSYYHLKHVNIYQRLCILVRKDTFNNSKTIHLSYNSLICCNNFILTSKLTFCLIRPGYVFCILLLTSISCLGTNIESIKNPTGKLDAMIYTCFVFLYIYMCKIQRMCLEKLSCTYYYKYLLFKYLCNIYIFH